MIKVYFTYRKLRKKKLSTKIRWETERAVFFHFFTTSIENIFCLKWTKKFSKLADRDESTTGRWEMNERKRKSSTFVN